MSSEAMRLFAQASPQQKKKSLEEIDKGIAHAKALMSKALDEGKVALATGADATVRELEAEREKMTSDTEKPAALQAKPKQ